ncbi:MAG: aldehyde dehydrogenase family protein, partial [Bacteroidia bacterium]
MSNVMTDTYGIAAALDQLGIREMNYGASTGVTNWMTTGPRIDSYSPADGQLIGSVNQATAEDYEKVMQAAEAAFPIWRMMPA